MLLARILIGILMLAAGQRLFWFFIGVLGFLAGSAAALAFSLSMPFWQVIAIGLICGFLGMVLAVFFQSLAIIIAGFISGAYIFFNLWSLFNSEITEFWWIFFLASGILGSIFLVVFLNPTLIIVTSFMGALMIIQSIPAGPYVKFVLLAFLFIIGMFIQSRQKTIKRVER